MRRIYFAGLLLCLVGCNGLDRIAGGPQRHGDTYDDSPPPVDVPRPEPWAVLAGYHHEGDVETKIYMIHWKGNALDLKAFLEGDPTLKGIPLYAE